MRLYLSSYLLGNHPEHLCSMVRGSKKTLVIANAWDGTSESNRRESLEQELLVLKKLGFKPSELDLRLYFGNSDKLAEQLQGIDLVWVRGGNSFVLRRAMRQSGFDKKLVNLLREDKFVYGGFSAGVVVLAPNLRGIELVDDAKSVPAGYLPEIIWEGLSVIPFMIAPHYQSNHPESAAIDSVVRFWEREKQPYKTLRDGQVLIYENAEFQLVS